MGLYKSSEGSVIVMVLIFSAIFLFFCAGVMKISEFILEQIENVSYKMQAKYLSRSGLQFVLRKIAIDRGYSKETWKRCPLLYKVDRENYFLIRRVDKEKEDLESILLKVVIEGKCKDWSNRLETKLSIIK